MIPYVALAHAFGRIGCFLNGCCYGKFCDYAWCVQFSPLLGAVHPTQLYESGLLLIIASILSIISLKKHVTGQVIAVYFVLYGFIRFLLEFLRADNPGFLSYSWNQWISILSVFAGTWMYVYLKKVSVGDKVSSKQP